MSENTEVQIVGVEEVGSVSDIISAPEVDSQSVEAVESIDVVEAPEVTEPAVEVASEVIVEPVAEVPIAAEPVVEVAPVIGEVVADAPVVEEVATEPVVETQYVDLTPVSEETVNEVLADESLVIPEVAVEVEAPAVEEVIIEAPVEAQLPTIVVAVTDPDGVLIVGGSTSDGKGYLMKKYEDGRECPTLTFGSDNRSVNVLYLDMKDDDSYDIICGCLDNSGRINIIRCDSDLNVIKAVHINKENSYINAIGKWNDAFLLSVVYENSEKVIASAIIVCDPEFNVVGATDVNVSVPEGFESTDPNTPLVTMLNQLVPVGDTLIIGGSVRMPDVSYGVIAMIDSEFNPIKACTLTIGDKKYTALHNLTISDDIISVMCIFTTSEQDQPMSVIKQFNMDLEEVVVVEESIEISETVTEDGVEIDVEVDVAFEKGYN